MTVDRLPFIPAWLDDLKLPPVERVIFEHIIRRGDCFESVPGIAKHIDASESVTRRALRNLLNSELIKESRRTGQTTIYSHNLTIESTRDTVEDPCQKWHNPVSDLIGGCIRSDRGPVSDLIDKGYTTKVKKKKSVELASESKEILTYLNEKAGKHFRSVDAHLRHIDARLSETGVTIDGIREMVDDKVASWKGDPKMDQYLRPQTLFNATNFAGYYDNRVAQSPAAKITYFEPANQPPGHELKKA